MGMTRRWLRFNLVGVLGFALQTTMLAALVRWAGLAPAAAVSIAVLVTVSHNFCWHEHVTWPDRPRQDRFKRWLSFHLCTGVLSVVGNVVVTMVVAKATRLPLVASNAVAVAAMSMVNFLVSDRVIFRPLSE